MAEYGTDSIQAIVNLYPRFDGKDKTQFLEYKDKLRVSLSFHRQSVAAIFQGEPKPTTAQNSPAVATWTRANENLFGILFFTTELSAHNVVKRHMGKTREDGVGNGQAAWNALEKKYNSNTKEARRAYHEYLHNAKMKSGDDPDDFLYTMDGYRERLKDMGQLVPDERYEDIILQALPAEYERVRTASYERRDFHLADIRRMMSALYIDCLSRPKNSLLVAGRGVAVQATGGDNSIIKCHYCGNPGHRQKNCVAWIAAQCKDGNQQTTRSTPLGRWERKAGGGSKSIWCSFHKPTTHSDETCRRQQQQMGNNGSANWANQGSDYPAVLTASDPPPGSNIKEQGISFAAVEVQTRKELSKEQSFWPSGPTGEAIASFDTSGLFSGFEGATSGAAINSGAQARGTRTHITDTLTTLTRALVMAVMLHYVWLTLGSFPYNRVASTNTNGQPETFGGSTDAEDGLALAAVPAAEKWNRGSNSLVSVMVDSGVSGHYFDDALIPGLRYRLDNYQALAIRRWITTAGGHQLKEAGQGLPRGHSIDAEGVKRLTQLSVLAGPDAGWDLFSVKQDDALSGGKSLSGTSECGKPREQPASLGEASPAGGAPQDGALEHPEQPMSSSCEHVEAPFARSLPLQHHGPSRHQVVTPEATRAGNATQSIKERNDNDCTRLVEIATDRTLSQLRRLGLYTEAFLTDIAHQTDGAESVVEYACAATNDQMYSVGEETEVVPNTFEEATITGSRWVYKINAEKSIGPPRLVPAALERPSSSRRGTVISAPEKPTSGTSRRRWGCRKPTIGTWAAESTTTNGAQARTKSRMEQWATRKGERMKETRRKASFAVSTAEMK
ncbi:unnamed protein product [Ascophyllum nodosum]